MPRLQGAGINVTTVTGLAGGVGHPLQGFDRGGFPFLGRCPRLTIAVPLWGVHPAACSPPLSFPQVSTTFRPAGDRLISSAMRWCATTTAHPLTPPIALPISRAVAAPAHRSHACHRAAFRASFPRRPRCTRSILHTPAAALCPLFPRHIAWYHRPAPSMRNGLAIHHSIICRLFVKDYLSPFHAVE